MTVQIDKVNDDSALSAWIGDTSLPDNHIIAQSMDIINIMYFEGLVVLSRMLIPWTREIRCAFQNFEMAHYGYFQSIFFAIVDANGTLRQSPTASPILESIVQPEVNPTSPFVHSILLG